jgi:hypothetical protein
MIPLFVGLFVIRKRYEAVFLARNHRLCPRLCNSGPHVAGVLGPVGEHQLARTQMLRQ